MPNADFEQLLQRLLDDEISENELQTLIELAGTSSERLESLQIQLIMSDRLSQYEDELRSEERFLAAMEVRLRAASDEGTFVNRVLTSAQEVSETEIPSRKTSDSRLQTERRRGLAGWMTAAVALAVLTGVLVRGFRTDQTNTPTTGEVVATETIDEPSDLGVAVLTRASGLVGDDVSDLVPGATIPPGKLAWEVGLIQLEFYGGATVIAEGPAALEILDDSRVICHSGRLRAHVPEPARGFVVLAPTVELVDLGTEFGIDVATNGETEVHVFDGKVELYDAASNRDTETRRELNAGDAVAFDEDGTAASIVPRSDDFVTPDRLSQLTDARRRKRLDAWKEFRDSLLLDSRVVAYFPFDRDHFDDRTLKGYSAHGELEGAIVGCEWSEGRWPDKAALQFKRPGDRVRISIPGKFESLTYSTWLRIDGLDRRFNSLLLADGFTPNAPHWQIRQDGRMILGIRHAQNKAHDYRTDRIFDLSRLGQWVHLATVYDTHRARVRHYVNGQLITQEPIQTGASGLLKIGNGTIGNWSFAGPTHQSTAIRNLNGRMDELIVFGVALSEDEIRLIHNVGQR